MSLNRTHIAVFDIDYKTVNIVDLTTDAEYTDAGVLIPSDITGVTLEIFLKDEIETPLFSETITYNSSFRNTGGYDWSISGITEDDRYRVEVSFNTSIENYKSTTNQYVIPELKINISKTFMRADWKDIYSHKSNPTYTKAILKLNRLLDELGDAEKLSAFVTGDSILANLKTYYDD